MTKLWRPKGWEDIHEKEVKLDIETGRLAGLQGNTLIDTFETGADAMLKALRELSPPNLPFVIATTAKGVLRFIPDDEELK